MIVEKQMECRLAGETEVLGENLSSYIYMAAYHFNCLKVPNNFPYLITDSENRL
jgi:hypothetical protein